MNAPIFLRLRRETSFLSGVRGGLTYGGCIFLVGSLPVFVLAFASFQVSVEIIVEWITQNLCQYLAAGFAIVALVDHVIVRGRRSLSVYSNDLRKGWRRMKRGPVRGFRSVVGVTRSQVMARRTVARKLAMQWSP